MAIFCITIPVSYTHLREKSVSNQKPYASVRTDVKNTIDHIVTVYLGIHFNGGIFAVQVLHHAPVPWEIQDIVCLMDAPHISKKTNGTLQSIGHAMIEMCIRDSLPPFYYSLLLADQYSI